METGTARRLDPELESLRRLLEMWSAQRAKPSLLIGMIDLLSRPINNLGEFVNGLLAELNKHIESTSALVALVVTETDGGLSKVVVNQGGYRVGAQTGIHDVPPSEYYIGGEKLPLNKRSLTGYAAFKKEPIVVPDVNKWKEETGFYRQVNMRTQSEIAVPILFEDRDVLGVINMESDEKGYFTDEHKDQLQCAARLISRVLEAFLNRAGYRKPYLTVLNRVNEKLRKLKKNADLTDRARKYLSVESSDILNSVAEDIAKSLNSEQCEIWILNKDRDLLFLEGYFARVTPREYEVELRHDELAKQRMEQRCLLNLPASSAMSEPLLIAPLLVGDRTYGVVKVTSPEGTRGGRRYTIGDERLLNTFLEAIAVAVHHKHLEWERGAAAIKSKEDVAELLNMFAGIESDIETILQQACKKIEELCKGEQCAIFIYSESLNKLIKRASTDRLAVLKEKDSYELGEGLTGWVGEHGKPLSLQSRRDQDLDRISPRIDLKKKEDERYGYLIDRPFMAVPIKLRGRTVGVIRCADNRRSPAIFTESDERIFDLIAAHIATALAFHERYDGEIKLLNNIKSVLDVIKDRSQFSEPALFEETLLRQILESAKNIFDADLTVAHRYRHMQLHSHPLKSGELNYEEFFHKLPDDESIVFEILKQPGGIRYIPDVLSDPTLTESRPSDTGRAGGGRFVVRENVYSSAAIRIDTRGSLTVILFLNYRGRHRTFNAHFGNLLWGFADMASLCLELSDMRRNSMEVATHIDGEVIPEFMRDVVVEAETGLMRLGRKDYQRTGESLYAIEDSAQATAAALSDVVLRLISHFPRALH